MKKVVSVLALLSITFVSAKFDRDIYDITYDSIYKANKIYYSLDKELSKVYKKIRKLMKRDKNILIKSEQAWIKKRDHDCAYPNTHSVNIDCAVKYTRDRLYFLKERLRECQESGCKADKFF